MYRQTPFSDGEVCDGGYCGQTDTCCRYIGNLAIEKITTNVNFIKKRWPYGLCPFHLSYNEPDSRNYPVTDAFVQSVKDQPAR